MGDDSEADLGGVAKSEIGSGKWTPFWGPDNQSAYTVYRGRSMADGSVQGDIFRVDAQVGGSGSVSEVSSHLMQSI